MPIRFLPRRGDWFRSKDAPTKIRCMEYKYSPRQADLRRVVSEIQAVDEACARMASGAGTAEATSAGTAEATSAGTGETTSTGPQPAKRPWCWTMPPGTDFGPVHDVDVWEDIVSVQVPSHVRLDDRLVWVNVAKDGQHFATMYPRSLCGFLD